MSRQRRGQRPQRGPDRPSARPTALARPAAPTARHPRVAIERAHAADLDAIHALELACFQPHRQASRQSLARSLRSPRQGVWVVRAGGKAPQRALAALLVVWHFPQSVRIYDVATHPEHRGRGLASLLIEHAERRAVAAGAQRILLEADPAEPGLVDWYSKRGYRVTAHRPGFYGPGRPAVRLEKAL